MNTLGTLGTSIAYLYWTNSFEKWYPYKGVIF